MTDSEREALDHMLTGLDEPVGSALRAQAESAMVVGRCACPCATIDLAVDLALPSAPATWKVRHADPADESAEPGNGFSLLLFLDNGRLSMLEIVYYGDVIPLTFPPASHFGPPGIST